MLFYHNANGRLFRDEKFLASGYSGFADGKNNPALMNEPDIGPIPCGVYDLEKITHPGLADPVFRLNPHPENNMFGRAGFLIHGDSVAAPGTASHGCIIMMRSVRNNIATEGDKTITVV